MPVKTPDTLRREIAALLDIHGLSLREIAARPEYHPIPFSTIGYIAETGKVPEKWRKRLNVVNPGVPYTRNRNTRLNDKARAAGWAHLSEYLTAVLHGQAEIPERR